MSKDCFFCKNSYVKDLGTLVCSVKGIMSLEDYKKSIDSCEHWEEPEEGDL